MTGNWAYIIDTTQLLASTATAIGVVFAATQFLRSVRADRIQFTMERLDRLHECIGPHFVSHLVQHCKADVVLPNNKFVEIYWSADRMIIRRGYKETRLFLALLERKRFDYRILGSLGFFSDMKEHLEQLEPYVKRIEDVFSASGQAQTVLRELRRWMQLVEELGTRFE